MVPSLCAFFAHFATSVHYCQLHGMMSIHGQDVLSYPKWLFRMVANISDSFRSVLMRFSLAWMPTTQFLVNDRDPAQGTQSHVHCQNKLLFTHHQPRDECSGGRS